MTTRVGTGTRVGHYNTRHRLDLTPRQRQVLAMIERGKTNFQIAEALGISLEGAKYHVSEILGKLDVESREAAASYWREYNRPTARLDRMVRGLGILSVARVGVVTAAAGGVAGLAIIVAITSGSGGNSGAGAAPDSSPTPETSTPTPIGANGTPTPTMVTATPGGPAVAVAVCLQGIDYREDGPIPQAAQPAGSATAISDIRFAAHPGCERVVIDLNGGDAGTVAAEIIRSQGVVRVRLSAPVTATGVTDSAFSGQLASRAYVVRAADAGLYVDLHLKSAAVVSVQVLASPARVVIDLKPGGTALPSVATTSTRMVLLTPHEGPTTYPLLVSGYSRTFEANVVLQLRQTGEVQGLTAFTTATDYLDAWGEFSFVVASGPAGAVSLFAGEFSARDGAAEGVTLAIQVD
jgi:DNA-binding CsgD family transcriptional regulator